MTNLGHRARVFSVMLTAVFGVALAACSPTPDSDAQTPSAPPTSAAPSSSAGDDEHDGTPIRIVIGDESLEATVWDTPTGQDLLSRLPLTLDFEDLSNREKVGHIDPDLNMNGMPEGDDPITGDLGYYAPWGNVVLYYDDVARYEGIARIGTIHGDLSIISGQTEDFTATLEAAE